MNRLHVCERIMTSHDACTSGTSRVPTVASLAILKMEALIPAPADCEVRSLIKFLNAQSIAPIEIHNTGLAFGEFEFKYRFRPNLLGFLSWFLSVIKANAVLDLPCHDPFNHYS